MWGLLIPALLLGLGATAFAIGVQRFGDPSTVVRHPVRQTLLDLIRRRPGAQAAALRRALDANRGTINYHLRMLERAGVVRVNRHQHATRYFPLSERDERVPIVAVLLRGRIVEVVRAIVLSPGISQKQLTRNLPISRKVLRDYADDLGPELLQEVRESRTLRYYPTPRLMDAVRDMKRSADLQSPSNGPDQMPPGDIRP